MLCFFSFKIFFLVEYVIKYKSANAHCHPVDLKVHMAESIQTEQYSLAFYLMYVCKHCIRWLLCGPPRGPVAFVRHTNNVSIALQTVPLKIVCFVARDARLVLSCDAVSNPVFAYQTLSVCDPACYLRGYSRKKKCLTLRFCLWLLTKISDINPRPPPSYPTHRHNHHRSEELKKGNS